MPQDQITKKCLQCGETKSYRSFSVLKDGGLYYCCRECNRLKHKAHSTDIYKDRQTVLKRRLKYGITSEQFDELVLAQNGQCPICLAPLCFKRVRGGNSGFMAIAQVEHDHHTGQIRGITCGKCNTAIGMLKDNPDMALRAYQYLRKYAEYRRDISAEEIEF